MFNNIGSKIKTLAKVICWVGIAASILSGIGIMFSDDDMIFAGLAVIVIGPILAWVGSFFTYGFGELIDNTAKLTAIAEKNEGK